ncbi:diguanylate cyclase domain-containing protein [Aliidiomarina sp. Khilg15.8]
MASFFRRLSTRLYLALAASLCVLLVAILSVSITVQEEALYQEAEEKLLQITGAYKTSLELILTTREQSLRNLVTNLERWESNQHPSLEDDAALKQLFDHLWIVNKQGDIVDEWPRLGAMQEGLNIASRKIFTQAQEYGDYFISEPEMSYYTQQPIVNAVAPMYDENDEFLGMVVGIFSLHDNTVLNRIASTKVGEGGYVAIATQDGTVIAHPDRRLIMQRLSEEDAPLVHKAAREGWQGIGIANTAQGPDMLQTVMPVSNSNWLIGTVLDIDEAMQPLHQLRRVQIGVGIACVIVSLAFLSWLLRAYLRPLQNLHDEVIDVQHGRARQLTEPGLNELRQLVFRFNSLLAQNESARQSLQKRQAYLDIILATSSAGLFMIDEQGKIQFTNQRLAEITGYSTRELKDPNIVKQITPKHRPRVKEHFAEALSEQESMSIEFQLRRGDGAIAWLHMQLAPVFAENVCIGHVGTVTDVTQHQQKVAELRNEAQEDRLTGLLNRRGIERALLRAFEYARQQHSKLLVLALDLDNFKMVNDTAGHEAGDWILQQVALTMQKFTRDSDHIGRLGGDEFILVLPGCPPEHGERIATELLKAIVEISPQRDLPLVTSSIGIVQLRRDDQSALDILRRADKAAYAAKHAGRNQWFSDL